MKAKNILMSVLLAMGFIAAKAAGYPPELALVSQPVLVYNYNSITVYYDVQNIGDYTYRGDICLFLSPDNGYCYAEKYVKVCPGRIKRVAIDIPAYRPNPSWTYTIMPYYELGDELYSFTTFEYFEPLSFYWNGPRTEHWVVINVPPRPRYYQRPGDYRYYYDGYRPPMPPPPGPGFANTPPPPMNPMHHTYNYHYNNGGYPGWNNDNPPTPNTGGNGETPHATVRPKVNGGSMSHGNANASNGSNGTSTGSATSGSNSGRTGNSSNVSRPSNNGTSTGSATSGFNSGRTGNSSNVSRPSNNGTSTGSATSGSNSGRTGNSSNVSRPSNNGTSTGSATSGSNSGRTGNSSNSRESNTNSRSGSNSGRGSR